jgi:hypothetical protein
MSRESRAARAAHSEMHLSDGRFTSLTSQLKQVYERIDGALVETLRLNAEMIETCQEMGLEPEVGQRLFVELNDCVGTIVESRQKMVVAHTRATGIRMRTNQAARADGCWPWRPGGGGLDRDEEQSPTHLRVA